MMHRSVYPNGLATLRRIINETLSGLSKLSKVAFWRTWSAACRSLERRHRQAAPAFVRCAVRGFFNRPKCR